MLVNFKSPTPSNNLTLDALNLIMVKCSRCSKKAEYYLPDTWSKPKEYYCENHAMAILKSGEKNFLPRLKIK